MNFNDQHFNECLLIEYHLNYQHVNDQCFNEKHFIDQNFFEKHCSNKCFDDQCFNEQLFNEENFQQQNINQRLLISIFLESSILIKVKIHQKIPICSKDKITSYLVKYSKSEYVCKQKIRCKNSGFVLVVRMIGCTF